MGHPSHTAAEPSVPTPPARRRVVSRRQFVAAAAGVAALGAGLWTFARGQKRNVILIISDSMRRDAVGCYGGWADTPHLDAFAAQGVRFDNAFLCSFPTVLARHDILTGTYTFTYKGWSPLLPSTLTLPDVLRDAGVHSALVADTPYPYYPEYGYHRSFQTRLFIRGQGSDPYVKDPVPVNWPCDPEKLWQPLKDVEQYLRNVSKRACEEDYFCARSMRRAARWLEENHKRQPFFLCVDTFDPHEPWDPPRSYVDEFDPGYDGPDVICPRYEQWQRFLTSRDLRHCRALYAAETSLVDRWVGQLFAKINALGLFENSLVLVISDHGVSLGEHGVIGKGVIRDHLLQNVPLYPELCRIPFLARFPGCRPGTVNDALVQPVNLAATVADYLGVAVPDQFKGASVWPVLRGEEAGVSDIVVSAPNVSPELHGKVPHPTDRATVTDGRWLLVYSCAGWGDELGGSEHHPDYTDRRRAPLTGELLVPQLYDLAADPGCLRDLYQAEKPRAADLHRRFFAFLRQSPMRRDHLDYFARLENS